MKIIIDAFQYAPAITGTDRMAKNFLVELQKLDSTNTYFVICSKENYIPNIITASNFKVMRPPVMRRSPLRRVVHKLWRMSWPTRLRLIKADVYFTFHNMRLPSSRVAKRMVSSNLDLIPLQLEEYKKLDPRLNEQIKQTAQEADAFMSISNFSKEELCTVLGVPKNKVDVIHLAADPDITKKHVQQNEFTNTLPPNFLLTIGGSEPRKNVSTVVEAFCKLPLELQKTYPLLIAGGSWHGIPLEEFQKNEYIHTLGFIPDEQLAILYSKATLFVFASVYEGFGFTILESMASGTPTLSANSSSLKEVAGNGAMLFTKDNPQELSGLLISLLSSAKSRKDLSRAGLLQSEAFTWESSARKLHHLLTEN